MQQINLEQVKVAVVGAGTMGIGIAQLAAMHGHPTYVFDLDRSKVQSALTALEAQLSKRVQNGKMTQQLLESTFANLIVAEDIQQLADAGLIIEAIVEKKEVKQNLFQQLAAICPEQTIFASNTSSISITAIASAIPHPERVIGLHFFNPAPVMKLVEIIRGLKTSAAISDAVFDLMKDWNKVPVRAKSTPGFIVNRVARPYYAEAFRALQENATTPEQLDYIMRECGRFAMGPCELTDLIGQDVNFSVTQSVYQEFFYEPRYRPSLIQKELVDAGCYGRKSGQGFYDYTQSKPAPVYELPVCYAKSLNKLKATVKGEWLHSLALIERLKQASHVELSFQAAEQNEILISGLSLRLSLGESVELTYPHEPVVLMDWHADWANAQAIPVVASPACSAEQRQAVELFLIGMDMIPIWSKDHPGLYVIRSIAMLVNEACEAVLHDIASEQDIDSAMKYGVNYPCGPFEWVDRIGYYTILQILENMYRIYGEDRYRTSIYLAKKAVQGHAQKTQQQPLRVAG